MSLTKRLDYIAKCGADDYSNREIDDVTAQDELLEPANVLVRFMQHATGVRQVWHEHLLNLGLVRPNWRLADGMPPTRCSRRSPRNFRSWRPQMTHSRRRVGGMGSSNVIMHMPIRRAGSTERRRMRLNAAAHSGGGGSCYRI